MDLDLETPFQPLSPVKVENFKGRVDIIKKILRYMNKSLKCEVQHFFLTGSKGMGKTSVAEFIIEEIKKINMLSIYISNKGNDSVEILASNIIKSLINKYPEENRIEKVKSWFGKHVSEIKFHGTTLSFNLDQQMQDNIKNDFLDYLLIAYEYLKVEYKGILIVIDDINGLSNSKEFVDWYKSFADTLNVEEYYHLPLYFLLASYPDKFDNMVLLEKSFGRLFHFAHVGELSDGEVKEFFKDSFKSVNLEINDDALEFITDYTSGVPLTMQYIGDSIFWNMTQNNISIRDAKEGIILASKEIRSKQLRVLNRIKENIHEEILIKIAQEKLEIFDYDDLKNVLTQHEFDYLEEFLNNMTEKNILKEEFNGTYKFVDKLDYTYYRIKSFEKLYTQSPHTTYF